MGIGVRGLQLLAIHEHTTLLIERSTPEYMKQRMCQQGATETQ